MKKLIAFAVLASVCLTPAFAATHPHRSHHAQAPRHNAYHHKAKHARGETCWRTNRRTGTKFRIC